jgi:hypothetical protein
VRKIGLAWALTLPAAILLSAGLFAVGGLTIRGAGAANTPTAPAAVSRSDVSAWRGPNAPP